MYGVLNTLSEYTYIYISKNILQTLLLVVSKIVESLQCILNHITSLKQTHLFFIHFLPCLLLFLDDKLDQESVKFSNGEISASGCCLAFAYFFTSASVALLIKVLLINKIHVNRH